MVDETRGKGRDGSHFASIDIGKKAAHRERSRLLDVRLSTQAYTLRVANAAVRRDEVQCAIGSCAALRMKSGTG